VGTKSGLLLHAGALILLDLAATAVFISPILAEDPPGGLFTKYTLIPVA